MTAADPDRMLALLGRIEEMENRRGWDRPPIVYALYDVAAHPGTARHWRITDRQGAGTQVQRDGYLAVVFLGGRSWPPGSPASALRAFATGVTHDIAGVRGSVAAALTVPGLLGAAIMIEAWSLMTTDTAVLDAYEAGDRSLADTPGAVEARDVLAVDGADRSYGVHRQRGGQQMSRWVDHAGDVPGERSGIDGFAHDSLRAFVSALFGRPRPDLLLSRPVDVRRRV